MSDEMARAHREDYEAERAARNVVVAIDTLLATRRGRRLADDLEAARTKAKNLAEHIVRVWD